MRTSYKFTLILALAVFVTAVMASGPPAEADPGYGNDFAPAVAGVIPGALYEPAPFGAPVVGPTVPPPAPALPALVPAGVDMDDISYGNDLGFPPAAMGLFVDFSTGPGAVGDIAAPFPPPPSIDVYGEGAFGEPDESDIYSNWPAPFTGPFGCVLAGNAQQLDGDGSPASPGPPYAPRFGLNLPELPAPASNLDAYELSDEGLVGGPALPVIPVFYTIDAATPWPGGAPIPVSAAFGGGVAVPGPADVIAWDPGLPGPVVWAPAFTMGLGPGDDIDALAVDYGFAAPPAAGGFGVGPPGTDTIWYSLAPGSVTLPGMPLSAGCPAAAGTAGDVWFHVGPGAPTAFFMAENIGLTTIRSGDATNDDIDAMDFCIDALGGGTNSDSERLGTDGPDADLLPDDRTNPHEDGRTAVSATAPRGNLCDYDNDNDWLSDSREAMLGTSPTLLDTDGDVFTDWVEVEQGSNPLMAASRTCTTSVAFCTDADADGVPDGIEALTGSSTAMTDSDGDLMSDRIETMHRSTNPNDPNTDNNTDASGCVDRLEILGLDGNSTVAFSDLLLFAASYNAIAPGYAGGPTANWDANKDFNGSGTVNFPDLLLFAAAYNIACPGPDLTP